MTTFFAMENVISSNETIPKEEPAAQPKKPFDSFTGKVTKNRVRLRLLPNLDGNIIKELNQGNMILIVDETDDFYAIEPLADSKAYIFRTYVLDNVVEGAHVNVRLRPDMDSPIVTQLNSGDRVQGTVDPSNSKWLEISMPKSVRFYVAKEYIERAGDRLFMAKYEKRQQEVNKLLNETQSQSQTELNKPFDEIHIDSVVANYKKIIQHYSDFTDQTARAKESLDNLQSAYNQKKLAYFEKNHGIAQDLKATNDKLATELKNQQEQVSQLKQQMQQRPVVMSTEKNLPADSDRGITYKMSQWIPTEQAIYTNWAKENNNASSTDFYENQKNCAIKLTGLLESYNRPVKNKPGDYLLINSSNHIPAAFLYSTHVNLQDWVGHEVTLIVAPRENNNYAYPAYYVLGIE